MTKLAVVSGGGTGIGAAIACGLIGDGFEVVVIGRRPGPLEEIKGAQAIAADLREPGEVERVREALAGRAIDVLVNNAGGYVTRDGDGLGAVAANWRATFDINVITAVLLTEALLPQLSRPGGRVLLFSSIAAQRGGGGPYGAAKAALHGWVMELAAQLGPQGITANVIAPGYVIDTEFFKGRMTPEGHQARVDATLVGQPGTPDDIWQAVRWLAGPGGGWVTGQIIGVNGGSVLGR
ncbi:SDR family NAD(P)-dependent oxidoreductase [Allorhizocola rhizosphaerae]|uniref:SDR family NAD(P)-dependent oxidoreductase n=1 Tax=Allorhizocola rhizosphaerae TaxID=1872709 RepID=UPI000E3D70F6|nr:SDR family oxidoreductase [Allorhizocola rhizosphaerae]